MQKRLLILITLTLFSLHSLAEKITGPYVWKMTYSVTDANAAAAFCETILDMKRIKIPDETLAKGRAWVKFPNSDLELHFVEAQPWRHGYDALVKTYATIDALDQNMTHFTTFMDNHGAIFVDNLDPYIRRFREHNIAFLGPVRRDDGVYQLYVEVPGHLYLEFDAKQTPKEAKAITWRDVNFGNQVTSATLPATHKTSTQSGK